MIQFKSSIKRFCLIFLLAAGIVALASGCINQEQQPVSVLFSPTPSMTMTPTVIWFPVTATPEIIRPPTATPNPASSPVFGQLLFADTFSGQDDWLNSQDSNGFVIVKEDSITLAVKKPRGSLVALRQNTKLTDYYMETTLNKVGFCSPDDQVGVVFRAQGQQSYYRLLIDCQGKITLQQVIGGSPAALVDWTPSSEIPPNLWKPIKIGIWVSGKVMRIYLNDHLQFETTRDTYKSGEIGYFAHAAGESALTVSFSALNVYQVGQGSAVIPSLSPTP
ncbi:MAG: hypothetical protein AB9897_03670 [Anaerolineaceae bacterium]